MISTSAAQMPMPAWSGPGANGQFEEQEHGSFDFLDPFMSSQLFNAGVQIDTQCNSQQSFAADAPRQFPPFSSPDLSLAASGADGTPFPVSSPYMTPDNMSVNGRPYAASSGNLNTNTYVDFGSPYGSATTRAASAQPMLGTTLLPLATGNLAQMQRSTSAHASHGLNTTPMRQRLHSHPTDSHQRPPLSPTVTIEECEDPAAFPTLSRHQSRRSHASAQPRTHLSPFDPVDRFDADDESSQYHLSSPVISQQGDYDGRSTFDAQDLQLGRGINPSLRGDEEIPSLDDQSRVRRLSEKNQDVEDWLTTSDIGSDVEGSRPRRKQSSVIRRSRAPARHSTTQSSSLSESAPAPLQASTATEPNHVPHQDLLPTTGMSGDIRNPLLDADSPAANFSATTPNHQLDDDSMASSCNSRRWIDPEPVLKLESSADQRCQPLTANAAMARFIRRAKETDNASLAATLASSRRKSESDMGSLFNAPLTSEPFIPGQLPLTQAALQRRGLGLFAGLRGNILDNATSKLKRKISNKTQQRGGALGQLEAETLPVTHSQDPTLMLYNPNTDGSLSLITTGSSINQETRSPRVGVIQTVRQTLSRNRSSSNLARSPRASSGLVAMWQQTGGPPVARLGAASISNPVMVTAPDVHLIGDESGEEMEQGGDTQAMDLSVRNDVYLHPSTHGFGYHATQLNPEIQPYLLARVVDEQMKRYDRLIRMASEHAQRVNKGSCPSKGLCRSLGGQYELLEPKQSGGHAGSVPAIFHVTQAGQTLDPAGEGQSLPAAFPIGIPLPPVPCLPARFECPFCFQVKDFHKPSDWTKHVHEDVQPFTCTFPNCNEPKSFKRKADWVRHESERHRQLESWTCNMSPDCQHICHRKDNFVQHLVREHKVPEPKVRTGRTQTARSPLRTEGTLIMSVKEVWDLVDSCKSEAAKDARIEPCRFCGVVCADYKKLRVHLAKHLEQISMPIITQLEYGMTSTAFPEREQPMLSTVGTMADPSGAITASPVTLMGDFATDPFGVYSSGNTTTAATYPPTFAAMQQASMHYNQGPSPSSPYFDTSATLRQPSFSIPGRQRSVSFNGQASPGMLVQGSTYPPVSMPTQTAYGSAMMQQEYSVPWQQAVPQGFYQGVAPGGESLEGFGRQQGSSGV